MTTHDKLFNVNSEMISLGEENWVSQATDTQEKSREILASESKRGGTLRRQLLITVLPTVLVPLAVVSTIGINAIQQEAKKEKLNDIENRVVLTSLLTDKFLQNGFNVSDLLAANPLVIQQLESGTQQVQTQGLLKQPIEKTEKQFADTKLLSPNPSLNNYLTVMIEKNGLAEIILTERNGHNVAYSSPTSDFVQSDEKWWQTGQQEGAKVLEPEFDESTQTAVLELVNSLQNSKTRELIGVTKIGVSVAAINQNLAASVGVGLSGSQTIQILDSVSGKALNTLTPEGSTELGDIIGGQPITEAAKTFDQVFTQSAQDPKSIVQTLEGQNGISNVHLETRTEQKLRAGAESSSEKDSNRRERHILSFEQGGRYFQLTNIPQTNLVVVSSIDQAEVATAGRNLMMIFAATAVVLGAIATALILLLARNLSQPLTKLAGKAQQVAAGDLKVQAELEGTEETRTLADNFNNLIKRVNVLIQEQEMVAAEQRQQKESLEQEIVQLMDELQGAVDGDLTVRASLTSLEMSTVADLFNAIIDSLRDIAVQVKESSTQVSSSLGANEQSMQRLAEQAIAEAEETRKTLGSVEQMSHSIEEVAANANQAAVLADNAYQETQEGSQAMDATVNSILSLRTTVGETVKKMKRLGESSQKISQVVSLIEEIALKTNLLAINASVEASRAGEQGQGFTVVAEQVGSLAEQSAAATKEIAKIVAAIQAETQEVTEAMELGTAQVVDTTRLVESTKQCLGQVLERSRSINELMQRISQSTVSQADTSRIVTDLMQQIAQQSEARLTSSQDISQSMQTTAQVAKQLESTVEQFKVNE